MPVRYSLCSFQSPTLVPQFANEKNRIKIQFRSDLLSLANKIATRTEIDPQFAAEALFEAIQRTDHQHAEANAVQYFFQTIGKIVGIIGDASILAGKDDVPETTRKLVGDAVVEKLQTENLQKVVHKDCPMENRMVNRTICSVHRIRLHDQDCKLKLQYTP
jgi:hypothetical protein